MIANVITDSSIFFIARARPWTLAVDHLHFQRIKTLLMNGCDDEDELVRLADARIAVSDFTDGRAVLSEEGLFLDGDQLPLVWERRAATEPEVLKVLVVNPGDRVRVEGDEDAPDGLYTVGDVDNTDIEKRVMVESEDGFLGFVSNSSIKEILK
ncbi:hypothetical protein [Bradyrhizobium sp. SZCCHNS3053]|uniref:hypothetical protein n=1 Tax=Bradyrhizobium sp. SZCCHNS3053 TaxID=3057322 RepID=UPI002916A705|nr:hypothetical protein [Bradyrhizobium sp. SZCCHNS3053]